MAPAKGERADDRDDGGSDGGSDSGSDSEEEKAAVRRAVARSRALREFLELGPCVLASVDPRLGRKLKEGFLFKRSGGRRAGAGSFLGGGEFWRNVKRRWFVLRDASIAYYDDDPRA